MLLMIDFIGKTPGFLKNHISTSIDAKDSLTPYLLRIAVPFLIQYPYQISMKLFPPTNLVHFLSRK